MRERHLSSNLKLLKSSYFSPFKLVNSSSAFNFALFLMSFTGHAWSVSPAIETKLWFVYSPEWPVGANNSISDCEMQVAGWPKPHHLLSAELCFSRCWCSMDSYLTEGESSCHLPNPSSDTESTWAWRCWDPEPVSSVSAGSCLFYHMPESVILGLRCLASFFVWGFFLFVLSWRAKIWEKYLGFVFWALLGVVQIQGLLNTGQGNGALKPPAFSGFLRGGINLWKSEGFFCLFMPEAQGYVGRRPEIHPKKAYNLRKLQPHSFWDWTEELSL